MFFNKSFEDLQTYQSGKSIELLTREYNIAPEDIIKLASNENPYGTSQKVVEKIKEFSNTVFRYPDDSFYELKEALANKFFVESSNIIIGAGSDQILNYCMTVKCNLKSKVIMAKSTFAMYGIYALQVGAKILKTKSDEHNLEEFLEIYKKNGADVIFLCLPNNPLGECLDISSVYKFLDKIDKNTLVIIDGAYQEYASYKSLSKKIDVKNIISKYQNTIYLGTFSKAYGLAGMRVGYGISNKKTISYLHKTRSPFNITTLSLVACIEALKDNQHIEKTIRLNFEQMERYENFAQQNNLKYIKSYANFITIFLQENNSSEISQSLLELGIIIRDLSSYQLNAIRITIGTKQQNTTLLKKLDKILNKGKK